jgi:hypothetical protein
VNGKLLTTLPLAQAGEGQVQSRAGHFPAGTYLYPSCDQLGLCNHVQKPRSIIPAYGPTPSALPYPRHTEYPPALRSGLA